MNRKMIESVSMIVLFFFTWTSVGMFDFARAANSQQSTDNSPAVSEQQQDTVKDSVQQSAISSQQSNKDKKSEEKFQKTIEEIEDTLKDTTTDTDAKKNKLNNKKAEIETLDVEIKKQFTETEKKIKDAKLSDRILQRHYGFIKRYNDNFNELKANLDDIDKAKTKSEADEGIQKAKAHLLKVKPPKKEKPFDPNRPSHKVPEIKGFETIDRDSDTFEETSSLTPAEKKPVLLASSSESLSYLLAQAGSGSIPSEYLSESIEVKITPEIQAKAQELEYNPVKIYEFVRNGFKYEPYYGSLKGAQQTLFEKAGNDFDQASLLIALLRASNIPARYVTGTIELPIERLMNWLGGAKTPEVAGQIMATNGIPGSFIRVGGAIKYARFEHVWVEAYVDMYPSMGVVNKQGKYWTAIDPGMKEMLIQDGTNISKTLPFDETAYLSSLNEALPMGEYTKTLTDYYESINSEGFFLETIYFSAIEQKEYGTFLGTLPFKVVIKTDYAEIPAAKRHRIRFGVSSDGGLNTAYVEKTLPEIAGKKITLSYAPATPEDQAVIDNYGGLMNTPAYLISVKPAIKLNGDTILSGAEMGMGGQISLQTEVVSPNLTTESITTNITHGISYAIGVPALSFSGIQLGMQSEVLSNLDGTINDSINGMDSRTGDLLHNIAIEYFGQLDFTSRMIESSMHVKNTKKPSVALVSIDVDYDETFGIPVSSPVIEGITIDAILDACSPISLDGDLSNRKEFIKHRGLNSSYLEHMILENLFNTTPTSNAKAISAVKAIQVASTNGIPIYQIDQSNINNILPLLTVSETVKGNITNAVNTGKEVMVSRDNVTYEGWTGAGYIVRDPVTGNGDYMISDALSGGKIAQTMQARKFNQSFGVLAAAVSGEPFGYGWLSETLQGFYESASVYFAVISWRYIPVLFVNADKNEIGLASRMPNLWIFHYSGHTPINYAVNNSNYPKLVFVNGCNSAGSLSTVFTINGAYDFDTEIGFKKGDPRKEAHLGWTCKINMMYAAVFAAKFWDKMAFGKSVANARDEGISGPSGCNLSISGNGQTTLLQWGE